MSERRDVPFGRPWITDEDRQAVMRVLNGHILTHGPECKAFEAEFASFLGPTAHCVSVSSCMAALHLGGIHFGLRAGDEVIVPALTHVATVHAVEWVGARPVFVDCDLATGNMTAEGIERAITPRTKAIVLVHFCGVPCDMTTIVAVASKHKLRVIEDCAIALGATWDGKHVGLFGDMGCFSFYPVKHITTAEGGMVVSKDAETIAAIAKLRAFGVDRTHTERAVPGTYDVPSLGLNYRMSELQATLGRTQTARLDENLRVRKRNFDRLKAGLEQVTGVRVMDATDRRAKNSHYCLVAVLADALAAKRTEIVLRLNERGVGTSVYYPQPVPRMRYYREKYGYDVTKYPNASTISDASIALPVGVHVSEDDVTYMSMVFRETLAEVGGR